MLHLSKKLAALNNGYRSEQLARHFLESNGLRLIQANVRYKFGEIDLVMREQNTIVFVEVKYRKQQNYGGAIESLGAAQARRLKLSASAWLQRYDPNSHWPSRFDLVAITAGFSVSDCVWIKNIFQ